MLSPGRECQCWASWSPVAAPLLAPPFADVLQFRACPAPQVRYTVHGRYWTPLAKIGQLTAPWVRRALPGGQMYRPHDV